LIDTSLSHLLQLFYSETYEKQIYSEIKSAIFFSGEEITKLNRFLHLFTQAKIKDHLQLNMLNMDSVSKNINLKRIQALVNHNTTGYRNFNTLDFNFEKNWDELYSNLFKYYYQYHLKQRLYLLDEINCMDLDGPIQSSVIKLPIKTI